VEQTFEHFTKHFDPKIVVLFTDKVPAAWEQKDAYEMKPLDTFTDKKGRYYGLFDFNSFMESAVRLPLSGLKSVWLLKPRKYTFSETPFKWRKVNDENYEKALTKPKGL